MRLVEIRIECQLKTVRRRAAKEGPGGEKKEIGLAKSKFLLNEFNAAMVAGEFHLCFFASRRIRAGREIIVDYGPDYWEASHESLLRTHAKGARRRGAPRASSIFT